MLLEDEDEDEVADEDAEQETMKKNGKLVAHPHQKKAVYRSNIQILGTMASTFSNLSAGQATRHVAQMEAERKREETRRQDENDRFERLLAFRKEENEADRKHDLAMARVFATAFTESSGRRQEQLHPGSYRMGMTSHTINPSVPYQHSFGASNFQHSNDSFSTSISSPQYSQGHHSSQDY